MFEDMTYENILNDMLSRVPDSMDKREGSIIYDALAPVALKLAETYFRLNNFIDLMFADTAVGEYLDRIVANYGITRKPATKAIRKIETTGPIDIGTRWGARDTTYVVIEKISDTEYKAECEQYGEIGNRYTGELENIDNVSGVTAILTDILVSGEDEETDEDLRSRFYNRVKFPATSGNANHYKLWALEVAGVGDVKVLPLWNGPGTVKVVVVNSNKQPASEDVVNAVVQHIEENRPIGAQVTVQSAQPLTINISANIVRDANYTLEQVKTNVSNKITEYLKNIAFRQNFVSYAAIGSLMLDNTGVLDYSNLTVNGGTTNIVIGDEQVAVLDEVVLHE